MRKRCARDHTVRATPDVIVVGEKRGKRGEEEKRVKSKGEKEKKQRIRSPRRPRSTTPTAKTGRGAQDEQPSLPPAGTSVQPAPAVVTNASLQPTPAVTTNASLTPTALSIGTTVPHPQPVTGPSNQTLYSYSPQLYQASQQPNIVGTGVPHLQPVAGPSNQTLYNYSPQLYQAPQQPNIVMETLKIVREIMLAGNIHGVPPIQYVRQIKQERQQDPRPAEIITVKDEGNRPVPDEGNRPVPEGDENKGEKKKEEKKAVIKEDDEEEKPERTETKTDRPPSKKRVNVMIQRVKNDEKERNKQKPSQSSPRD